ncbi:MAG: GAF domain-containing sensor histidine kinase [Anaerolineae bacterium]|nr:GAF domain-containing sensor histidine kinase [Anaerolineae bacterium]
MASRPRPETDTDMLRQRNRELSILNTIAAALNHEVDLTQALDTALVSVAELFGLQTGWVFLLDAEGKSYLAAAQNLPPALADHPRRMGGTCTCLDDYAEGQLHDPQNITCSRLENLVVGTAGLRFHASIPLDAYGKPLGVLNVASTDWEELSADDLRLLYTVGDLVSIAVERARLFNRSVELGAVEERNRLAREIHDTLAQGLSAIALHIETADALLEAGADLERVQQAIQRALASTRTNLEEARRSVMDLRAAPLEGRNLGEALAKLAQDSVRKGRLDVRFEEIGSSHPLPPRVEIGLYRVAEEAVRNARRHAHARNITIQLVIQPERVELAIDDDGRGFDPSGIPEGHYGLIGINERVRLLGGTVELRSCIGEGTHFDIVVPLGGQA